ncbi:MAG: RNA-binding S4 domain-containing protein [Polyangiales bacterium]
MSDAAPARVRLDKWLWAARFYKTRSAASKAVHLGQVRVGGSRTKAARLVQVGDHITLRRGLGEIDVKVDALSERRGPASVAATLYHESAASIERRARDAEARRIDALASPRVHHGEGKISGRDRRQARRLKAGQGRI